MKWDDFWGFWKKAQQNCARRTRQVRQGLRYRHDLVQPLDGHIYNFEQYLIAYHGR